MKRLVVALLVLLPLTGAAQAQTLKDLMATLAASWNQPTEFVDPNEFNAYAAKLEKAFEESVAKQTEAARDKKG